MEWKLASEIVGFVSGIAALMGLILVPMFYLGSKIDGLRTDLEAWKNATHLEIKDFHGRLERQDAEFKARLLLIEERMKK